MIYALGFFLFSLVSYWVGGILRYPSRSNPFLVLFERLFWGALLLGVFYALYATRGKTVLGIILVISIAYVGASDRLLLNARWGRPAFAKDFQPLIIALALGLVSFGLQFFRATDLSGNLYALHPDFLYYGRLAWFISTTGLENTSFDVFLYASGAPSVYHYLEIWQTALVSHVLGLNMALGFYLVVVPFYFGLIMLGLVALLVKLAGGFRNWFVLLAPVVLFVSTLGFADVTQYWQHFYPTAPMDEALYNYPKLILVFVGLIYVLNVDFSNGYFQGFLVAICGLMFPVTLPALFTAWGVLCVGYYVARKLSFPLLLKQLAFPVAAALLILLFYFFAGMAGPDATKSADTLAEIKAFYFSRYGVVSVGYNVVFYILSVVSTLAVYFLVFYFALRRETLPQPLKHSIAFLGLLIFFGVVYFSLFLLMFNSWQLHQNTFVPSVALLVVMCTLVVLASPKQPFFMKFMAIALLVLNLVVNIGLYEGKFGRGHQLTIDFYHELHGEVAGSEPRAFGFFRTYHDLMSTSAKNPLFTIPGHEFAMFVNDFLPVCLSVFDIPVNESPLFRGIETSRIQKSIFYRFVEEQKASGSFRDVETSVLDFVEAYGLRFLFFEHVHQLPQGLLERKHRILANEKEGFGVLVLY